MRRRTPAAALLAALVALALGGCVGIPSGGGVNAGDVVTADDDPPIATLASGPVDGSPPDEILSGFLQAATSPEENYRIARQYLTQNAAGKWQPNASVIVRDGAGSVASSPDGSLTYTVTTRASVSADGVYREERGPSTQELPFRFSKVGDEWRIDSLPDGIVLSRDNFDTVFAGYPIYFFDPTYAFLVPDLRWFPSRSSTASRIVSALLGGQASWWQQGVTLTAFPQGTRLSTSVTVTSNTALVDLSTEARTASPRERARMEDQLLASLGSLNVGSVTMSIDGAPLDVQNPGSSSPVLAPAVDPDPLVRAGARFGFANGNRVATIADLSSRILALSPTAVTLGRGRDAAAVLSGTGAYLVAKGQEPLLVDARKGQVEPSIDPLGYVWTARTSSPQTLRATGSDGIEHPISSTLDESASLRSFAISRDGTRIAFYLVTDSGPRLQVGGILRRDGVPAAIGELLTIPVDSDEPIDLAWADDRTLATLASSPIGQTVRTWQVGGPGAPLGRADGGVEIVGGNAVGGNGVDQLRVLTADGQVLQRRASGWQSTGLTVDLLATQQ